ncbi:hypothetical protein TBLA_0D04290 [Henningerozyma blattae CBS 6284]|uniref:Uncharacterized protein n=1 Tax=Henningerozyma blattae (strain ATCC 34711 / CBS 6284 / DSM 70876 / NBRC 10599 / NRRL Y-10934 / UCD 77-7) TaxID=1071380 RepID=I2H3H3_HENB6|nr:hypothetical protein TBLA_0D04290 [Tetrapisispora blattae CBS 6284]CCH60925.1 hypothetical protein TBLA_0D04290 [Tetrapisispora blattae CBS 6284]
MKVFNSEPLASRLLDNIFHPFLIYNLSLSFTIVWFIYILLQNSNTHYDSVQSTLEYITQTDSKPLQPSTVTKTSVHTVTNSNHILSTYTSVHTVTTSNYIISTYTSVVTESPILLQNTSFLTSALNDNFNSYERSVINYIKDDWYSKLNSSVYLNWASIKEDTISNLRLIRNGFQSNIIDPLITQNNSIIDQINNLTSTLYLLNAAQIGSDRSDIDNISLDLTFLDNILYTFDNDSDTMKNLIWNDINFTNIDANILLPTGIHNFSIPQILEKRDETYVSDTSDRETDFYVRCKIISIILPFIYLIMIILLTIYDYLRFKLQNKQFNALFTEFLQIQNEKHQPNSYTIQFSDPSFAELRIFIKNISYTIENIIIWCLTRHLLKYFGRKGNQKKINNFSVWFFKLNKRLIILLMLLVFYTQLISSLIKFQSINFSNKPSTSSLQKRDDVNSYPIGNESLVLNTATPATEQLFDILAINIHQTVLSYMNDYIDQVNTNFTTYFNNVEFKNSFIGVPSWNNLTNTACDIPQFNLTSIVEQLQFAQTITYTEKYETSSHLVKLQNNYMESTILVHWCMITKWLYISWAIAYVIHFLIGIFIVPHLC